MSLSLGKTTLIVIPTYNEADNIGSLLDEVFATLPTAHVLVVDDNSQDGTQKVVKAAMSNRPEQIFILARPGKLGLGTAYVAGFQWGLARGYEYLVEMDADHSHDPAYLPSFLVALESHHVVVGSRYVAGGGTKNWGFVRKLVSRFGSFYGRLLLGLKIRDLTGGYNAWRREVLEAVNLSQIRSEGYSFQIELKYRAWLQGYSITELPIVFVDRRVGKSKMSSGIVLEAMLRVWSFRKLKKSYPR